MTKEELKVKQCVLGPQGTDYEDLEGFIRSWKEDEFGIHVTAHFPQAKALGMGEFATFDVEGLEAQY